MYLFNTLPVPWWRHQRFVNCTPRDRDNRSTIDERPRRQTVACVNCKLKEIEALPDSRHRPQWFPLYGAPLVVPTSTEIADMAKRMTSSEVSKALGRDYRVELPRRTSNLEFCAPLVQ